MGLSVTSAQPYLSTWLAREAEFVAVWRSKNRSVITVKLDKARDRMGWDRLLPTRPWFQTLA